MPKFKAKNDTYYRFSYIRKEEEVNGGAELYDSCNFEPIDGQKIVTSGAETTQTKPEQPAKPTYKELCLLGKELGIENYNKMPYPILAEKVAEAQVKAAQPNGNEGNAKNEGNDGGDSAGNTDENKGNDGGNDTGDASNQ